MYVLRPHTICVMCCLHIWSLLVVNMGSSNFAWPVNWPFGSVAFIGRAICFLSDDEYMLIAVSTWSLITDWSHWDFMRGRAIFLAEEEYILISVSIWTLITAAA